MSVSVINLPLKTIRSNISEIALTSRYPEKGSALNTKSEMTVYILKGKVTLHQKSKKRTLTKGSIVLVKAKQPYFWLPNPKVTLLIVSSPPWTVKQSRNV